MNYYFDTSSLVKIYHPEDGSKAAIELYKSAETIFISELSKIEFLSTIYRKFRGNEINSETLNALAARFQDDIETRYELLEFSSLVFEESSRFVCDFAQKYSLKTLDSLQFAFFTTYCEENDIFVCSDKKLTSIVELEGITVFVPTGHIQTEKARRQVGKTSQYRIFLSPPHIGGEEMRFVNEAFESNYIAPVGPQVVAFEKEFCKKVGVEHAVALSSGTAAIHLALRGLKVKSGDIVFASTLTFIGSVTPVVFQGATPVFIDCDRKSWNLDPDLLQDELQKCSRKNKPPKALIVTDLYGQCCDYDRIFEICNSYKISVIVDAAEALGAQYKDRNAGNGAKAAIYFFNGNKIITTSGGGMLVSEDKGFIDYARNLSQQAREDFPHYEHTEIGYNYRMSNILAAIGRGQLRVLDERVKRKREIFDYYQNALGELPGIEFMPEPEWSMSNRWLTVILITPEEFGADKKMVRLALEAENIEARPVWKPMHMQPVFNPQIASRKGAKVLGDGGQRSEVRGQRLEARKTSRAIKQGLLGEMWQRICLSAGYVYRRARR